MFGSKIQREYKNVILQIKGGQRRDPQPDPAHSIEKDGTAMLRSEHRVVWGDFTRFGEIVDTLLRHGPWSIEETNKVEFGFDGPDYGRHYRLWYNHQLAGTLQVGVADLMLATEGHGARAYVDLAFPQLIPEPEVRDLLRTISFMFLKAEDGTIMRANADMEVVTIMTRHLWEVVREPEFVHSLQCQFEGTYEHFSGYLQSRTLPPDVAPFDFKFDPGQ